MYVFLRLLTVAVVAAALSLPLYAATAVASTAVASSSVAADAEADRGALAALHRSAGGDNWKRSDNWLTDAPLDDWHGVATDGAGRVLELDLSDNYLAGALPAELGDLAGLELLDLSGNELRGNIPPELGNLANLTYLGLGGNRLSGAIPPELGNLVRLEILDLWNNRLRGAIPAELAGLAALTLLDLESNRLSGSIPVELAELSALEELYLSGNRLRGCLPAAWEAVELSDLNDLDLPFCAARAPTPAPVPQALSSVQIFAKVSPAVAFIQTDVGSGSGVLIDGGYLVTNAHVVWPYRKARVVFPDGSEFDEVDVAAWDLMADLAVLGPVDATVQPAGLLDGETVPIGSDMYLIGYPGEVEAFPQPTIARGILSRLRQWEPVGISYLQADATIAGGQSGGALVSAAGDVIGISGFGIIEGKFALVASAGDLLPRVRQLIAGEDPAKLGRRVMPLANGDARQELTLQSSGDVYIFDEPVGTQIDLELTGPDDGSFRVYDSHGNELTEDETDSFVFETERRGPHFVVLLESASGKFTLSASHPLTRFDDPDRNRQIRIGRTLHGNIDFPGDIDSYTLRLRRNETVEVVVQSTLADPFLAFGSVSGNEWVEDDDSGGGLFGLDARIVYKAPATGEYVLIVANSVPWAPGGYLVTVDRAGESDTLTPLSPAESSGAPVPVVSIQSPLADTVGESAAADGGQSAWPAYENEEYSLRVFYPAGWLFAAAREELFLLLDRMGSSETAQSMLDRQAQYIDARAAAASALTDSLPDSGAAGRFVGLGFQFDPAAAQGHSSRFDLFAIPAGGRTLEEFGQQLADRLEQSAGVKLESVDVGQGLRPWGEEAASIRFRHGGTAVEEGEALALPGDDFVGWQVALLSPDRETFLLFTLELRAEEFAEMERTLRRIVRLAAWREQPAVVSDDAPTVTVNRAMNVRAGPGTNHAVVGGATQGQQFPVISANAAGDWWQIAYEGQMAWVFGGLVTSSPGAAGAPRVDSSGWLTYDDDARGLSISYPPGWRYFNPGVPSQADLALFSLASGGRGSVEELRETVSAMSLRREDAVIGLGLHLPQTDPGEDAPERSRNFLLAFSFSANGVTLDRFSQKVEDRLQSSYGVEVDRVDLTTELRPLGEEAVSIRYREEGTGSEVWQVWLLSPEGRRCWPWFSAFKATTLRRLNPCWTTWCGACGGQASRPGRWPPATAPSGYAKARAPSFP